MACTGTSKEQDSCNCEKMGCDGCYYNDDNKKEISLGNLYDVNKNLVEQYEVKLSKGTLNSKKEIVKNFINKTKNKYYMLLCNERKDYTVFHNNDLPMETSKILIDECLPNRGEIRGIDVTKDRTAIEI